MMPEMHYGIHHTFSIKKKYLPLTCVFYCGTEYAQSVVKAMIKVCEVYESSCISTLVSRNVFTSVLADF